MSFKDVKDLGEHLKLIGYPKNFQLSIFCTNYGGPAAFAVVADILKWLINRLDPSLISGDNSHMTTGILEYLSDDTSIVNKLTTENDRVQFIRAVAEFLITKCGIKINPRKLYSSSFSSAKELLKITQLLLNTTQNFEQIKNGGPNDDTDDELNLDTVTDLGDSSRINDLRRTRELSSELTNHGAVLYDLLNREVSNKEIRNVHANRAIEFSQIERTLKQSINQLEISLKQSKDKLEQIKTDKVNIINKVERKQNELERSKHRLEALKKVRPAYLDEFNKHEDELKELFAQYILRIRVVDSLKAQLNTSNLRTPTPPNIPVVRPSDKSINAILSDDMLLDNDDSEDDSNEVDDDEDKHDGHGAVHESGARVKFGDDPLLGLKPKRANAARAENRNQLRTRIRDKIREDRRNNKLVHNDDDDDNQSDIDLDSSINSDESDSVLAELARDNLMDHSMEESFNKMARDPPVGAHSDEDF